MEESRTDTPAEQEIPKFRGLYRYVKISVRALDWIIGICIAVIVLVVAWELRDPGFTVTFDSRGGSDVAAVSNEEYGQPLTLPEPPTREGYTFTGWYKDVACDRPWDPATDIVETDMTLYAGWQKLE